MAASFTSTLRQAGLVLAFAGAFSALSSSASFAFSAEAQSMCTGRTSGDDRHFPVLTKGVAAAV
jgi:hypothetical protein